MRVRSWAIGFSCVMLALGVLSGESVSAWQQSGVSKDASQQVRNKQLHKFHTAARSERSLVGSRLVSEISRDAQKHADWMASTGQFVHSGMQYWEVILTGPKTSEKAIAGWLESPAHCEILMSGGEIGFGFAEADGVTYWVGLVR
jgi:uncharacterized protein YkwD